MEKRRKRSFNKAQTRRKCNEQSNTLRTAFVTDSDKDCGTRIHTKLRYTAVLIDIAVRDPAVGKCRNVSSSDRATRIESARSHQVFTVIRRIDSDKPRKHCAQCAVNYFAGKPTARIIEIALRTSTLRRCVLLPTSVSGQLADCNRQSIHAIRLTRNGLSVYVT